MHLKKTLLKGDEQQYMVTNVFATTLVGIISNLFVEIL